MNQETEVLDFFGPLLADPSKIKREAVRRRKLACCVGPNCDGEHPTHALPSG
jgi:hypothetical protein